MYFSPAQTDHLIWTLPDMDAACRQPLIRRKRDQKLRSSPQVRPSRMRPSDGRCRRTRRNGRSFTVHCQTEVEINRGGPLKTEGVRANGRIWILRLPTNDSCREANDPAILKLNRRAGVIQLVECQLLTLARTQSLPVNQDHCGSSPRSQQGLACRFQCWFARREFNAR